MEEDKIVLDRKSFEALAVDSRVKILKSLKERRKTLSEIAKEQGMSVSGTKEHLETLEKVGLIEKKDDGHKWKYYELTKKGSDIVGPRELRVWILLSLSALALIASVMAMVWAPAPEMQMQATAGGLQNMDALPLAAAAPAPESGDAAPKAMAARDENVTQAPLPPEEPAPPAESAAPDLTIPMAVAGISGLSLLLSLAILARNRMRNS
jgi:predicted transcriptional regulator